MTQPSSLPTPKIGRMGYNPANFAHHIGTGPWVPGYSVYYAISFYDAKTGRESPRSRWWGPKTDPKQLYGGFGLIRIPPGPTGQATARRIWRRFEGEPERLIAEIPDNVTTTFQDGVLWARLSHARTELPNSEPTEGSFTARPSFSRSAGTTPRASLSYIRSSAVGP